MPRMELIDAASFKPWGRRYELAAGVDTVDERCNKAVRVRLLVLDRTSYLIMPKPCTERSEVKCDVAMWRIGRERAIPMRPQWGSRHRLNSPGGVV